MLLSLVIPVFNEQEMIPLLLRSLKGVLSELNTDHEIVFVNDGSIDATLSILLKQAQTDERIKVLSFSRNFGHQLAITAGIDFAQGDAVVVMDADLQDPPEILKEMLVLFDQGYDVVSAQRISRQGDSFYKRATASLFYWLMRKAVDQRIVPEVGDFRLFSRRAIMAIRNFREQHRFMRGLVAWLGLKEAVVPFDRQMRKAGETKYPTLKMLRFAWTAITSFSGLPLHLCLGIGVFLMFSGLVYIFMAIYAALVLKLTVPGWTSLVCLQIIFSGTTLMAIGLIGDYLARVYEESKYRPLYVLEETVNLKIPDGGIPRVFVLPRADGDGKPSNTLES